MSLVIRVTACTIEYPDLNLNCLIFQCISSANVDIILNRTDMVGKSKILCRNIPQTEWFQYALLKTMEIPLCLKS